MKVLITLGPTQEPIDVVRFISNASSGKMGAALAREAVKRGYEVTLVSGPVNIRLPEDARILRVKTAGDMISTSLTELRDNYDLFISTAAIADYSPVKIDDEKIKSGKEIMEIKLMPTPKLTREVRINHPNLFIAAFKAEYNLTEKELIERARSKLNEEHLNLVVANDLKKNNFGSDSTEVIIINKKKIIHLPRDTKGNIAEGIWKVIDKERKKKGVK